MDRAHRDIDRLLAEIEAEISEVYRTSIDEFSSKLDEFEAKFDDIQKALKKRLDEGEITKKEYQRLMRSTIIATEYWQNLRDSIAMDYVRTNQKAAEVTNRYISEIFLIGMGYQMYSICRDTNLNISFNMRSAQYVKNLLRTRPDVMNKAKINVTKDFAWNKSKITDAVLTGVLQGESIPKIAKRITAVTGMNNRSSVRTARTITTGAENAGRDDAFQQARERGIEVEDQWVSTLDSRTRHSHIVMDGEIKKIGRETFSNGLRYPGDPRGVAAEIMNCRCGMRGVIAGVTPEARQRYSKLGNMSYDEWQKNAMQKILEKEKRQREKAKNNSQ